MMLGSKGILGLMCVGKYVSANLSPNRAAKWLKKSSMFVFCRINQRVIHALFSSVFSVSVSLFPALFWQS